MKKNHKRINKFYILLLLFFLFNGWQRANAQLRHERVDLSKIPLETIKNECKFFVGDTLNGFPLEATIERYVKQLDIYSELKSLVYFEEIAFVKEKYNIKQLQREGERKIISNPIVLSASCNNVDFESGTFSGWIGNIGYNANSNASLTNTNAGINTLGINSPETGCSFHTLMTTGTDPNGGFSVVDPGGGTYAVRLGGENINTNNYVPAGCTVTHPSGNPDYYSNGETLEQTFLVTNTNSLFTYNYAVVLERATHVNGQQPYFRVEVLDNTGTSIPCLNYYVQGDPAGNYPPGFINVGGANGIEYLPWQTSSLNLLPYLGQNVTVRFTAAGCIPGGHFGYGYVDCSCAPLEIIIPTFECQGGVDSLIAPPVSGSTYAWAGPGIISGGTAQIATANLSGTYSVTITNGAGCSYVLDTTLVFYATPTVTINSVTICTGGTTTLTANSTGSAGTLTYAWNPATGLSFSPGDSVATVTPPASTSYTVTGKSVNGCTNTAVSNITVNTVPPPTFTATTVCYGSPTVFANATATGDVYSWNFGDPATLTDVSSQADPSYTYLAAGNYAVNFTVTTSAGCKSNTTQTVTVNPTSPIEFNADHPCDGSAVNFTNTTANQTIYSSWHWDFGNGDTTNVASPTAYTYTAPTGFSAAGCYSVVVTGTTTTGCTSEHDTIVYVHNNPFAYFNVYYACLGEPSDFIDSSFVQNPSCMNDQIISWNYDFGDGQTSTYNNTSLPDTIKHTYLNCGAYNITLTVTTNNNCINTNTFTGDSVFCLPVVSAPPSFSICPGLATPTQTFTSTVTNGGPAYTIWFTNYPITNTGMNINDTLGYDVFPSYNTTPKNMSCAPVTDVVYGVAASYYCLGNIDSLQISVYPTPYLSHMINDSICANQTIIIPNFTACPTNSGIAWTNNNTSIGLAANGTGNIGSFTGTNTTYSLNTGQIDAVPTANGCVGNDSSFVIIIKPLPSIAVASPTPYCPGDNVSSPTFTLNPSNGINYNWTTTNNINIGMPASGSTLPAPYIAPANNSLIDQTGVVTYSTSLNGCLGIPATETITIKPTPIVTPLADEFYCPENIVPQINFTCTPSGGTPIFSYSGLGGIGISQQGSIQSFTATNTTNLPIVSMVSVNATLNGCKGPDTDFNITVFANPVANFSYTPVCEGALVNFTDQSTIGGNFSITSWEWNLDAINIPFANSQNPSYSATPAGTHSVNLLVHTSSVPSCTAQTNQPVIIYPNPTANFTADNLKGCPSLVTTFTNTSPPVTTGSIVTSSWSFGNGLSAPLTQTYTNASATIPQFYNVSLMVTTDKGCTATKTINSYIEVYPKPIAEFSWGPNNVDILDPSILFANQSIGASTYTPTLTYGQYGIEYFLDDTYAGNTSQNNIFNNTSFTHIYSNPDYTNVVETYNVTQWVINSYGCKDSIMHPVEIQPIFTFYIPNAFSPNKDGTNDGFKGTGIGIDNTTYNLWIFDRWGLMIYHATNLEQAWDGHMRGNDGQPVLQEDVYVWKVKFNDIFHKEHEYHGTVTLIK